MIQPKTYYDVKGCKKRIQIHQGGTRSGKSFSITQCLIEHAYKNQNANLVISMVRKTYPSLRSSVMRDFMEILLKAGWYHEKYHNKTENTYRLFGNTFEFFSCDNPLRLRGKKRDILWLCEANELSYEDFFQLNIRTTTGPVILDFNPSDEFSYIYDLLDREDSAFFRTTYKDNPFLSDIQIEEIERLKTNGDSNYWRVYGLGMRGISRETIFETQTYKTLPEGAKRLAIGLDWGYSVDPTSIVDVYLHGQEIYIRQMLYSGGYTNEDIARFLKEQELERHTEIIADSAEPKSIETLHRLGHNVKGAKKGPDSVRAGIDIMKRYSLKIHESSADVIKEFRNYKWSTDKDGRMLPKPVGLNDHSIDAVRYVCLNKLRPNSGQYFVA
jgi:phage terminase large subunit